jgi:hypothetical protein
MITTQCWNWIHDASNWCQLSTWSQPSVEIECITKQICFNMINSLNQLHFTSSNVNSKQMAESSQSQHFKAGTWTSPSPWSPCWKACSSSPCNGSSPHGKFKPATDKNRKNILWSCSPKKPNLYSLYYPLASEDSLKCGTKWTQKGLCPLRQVSTGNSSKRKRSMEFLKKWNSQFILAPSEHSSKCGTKWTPYCSRAQAEPIQNNIII